MKKTITILAAIVIILGISYIFSKNNKVANAPMLEESSENSDEGNPSLEDKQVRGVVVSVNTDQVPVDGPALIVVRGGDGKEVTIALPSMGINLCPAQPNLTSPYAIKSGDEVEVRGKVGAEGVVLPCESSSHYLKVVTQ